MSDLKLFRISNELASEISSDSFSLEKSLQTLIERNLETMLGIRFLASEYATGNNHAGRIDTLGIDEDGSPVILEYKRSINENVVLQGLFYLDWLLDHKAEFQILVGNNGQDATKSIDWDGTRLLCIAADFTRYDEHALHQIDRNIELIRYHKFGNDLLLLDLVNRVSKPSSTRTIEPTPPQNDDSQGNTEWYLANLKGPLLDVFESIRSFLIALGDDVQEKHLSLYIAFKRIKNFVCIQIQRDKLLLYLKLNPEKVALIDGLTRDVRNIGHWATGDLEVTIRSPEDFEKAKPLIIESYKNN